MLRTNQLDSLWLSHKGMKELTPSLTSWFTLATDVKDEEPSALVCVVSWGETLFLRLDVHNDEHF